jgi:PIN domain nuclease of toxin-antitoxin system
VPSALDASALLALVRAEPGQEVVAAALADPDEPCFAHYMNLCELFYVTLRERGEDEAQEILTALIDESGVISYGNNDPDLFWEAGRLRALATSQRLALSLGDCFCIATARALGAELLTCDRHEFEPVQSMELCTIRFIR